MTTFEWSQEWRSYTGLTVVAIINTLLDKLMMLQNFIVELVVEQTFLNISVSHQP